MILRHVQTTKIGLNLLINLQQNRRFYDRKCNYDGHESRPSTAELDTSGGLCTGPVDLAAKERSPTWWNVTDAAMSIEVGEHIPAQFEANFVNNLGTSF